MNPLGLMETRAVGFTRRRRPLDRPGASGYLEAVSRRAVIGAAVVILFVFVVLPAFAIHVSVVALMVEIVIVLAFIGAVTWIVGIVWRGTQKR